MTPVFLQTSNTSKYFHPKTWKAGVDLLTGQALVWLCGRKRMLVQICMVSINFCVRNNIMCKLNVVNVRLCWKTKCCPKSDQGQ